MAGRRLGKFVIREKLGQGGMGTVFLAVQDGLGREVALKVLPAEGAGPEMARRFLREAAVCSRISHPNVVTVFDYGVEDDCFFYAMERLRGRSLEDLLRDRGALPAPEAVPIARDVLRACSAFHPEGIVHRDIKPANVMLDEDGRSVLTDFGLVKDLRATALTMAHRIVGTPAYMSPEMARGEPVTPASDLYQVGVLLYRMLSGRLPVAGDDAPSVLYRIAAGEVVPLADAAPGVAPGLAEVVMQLLATRAEDRFESAKSALAALGRTSGPSRRSRAAVARPGATGSPADTSVTGPLRRPPGRSVRLAMGAVLSVAAAGGGYLLLHRGPGPDPIGGLRTPPIAGSGPSVSREPEPAVTGLASPISGAVAVGSAAPATSPGAADVTPAGLLQALVSFEPSRRVQALEDRLRALPVSQHPALLAGEAREARSGGLGRALEAVSSQGRLRDFLPAGLGWSERARRSRGLFQLLCYDLFHIAWTGGPVLRSFERFGELATFETVLLREHPWEPTREEVEKWISGLEAEGGAGRLLVDNVGGSDSYVHENIGSSYVPDQLAGIFDDLSSKGRTESPLEAFDVGPRGLLLAGIVHDVDRRTAFLVRIVPEAGGEEAGGEEALVPLFLFSAPEAAKGWFLTTARLAPGVLPAGRYAGRLTAHRVMSRYHSKPNLAALYALEPSRGEGGGR